MSVRDERVVEVLERLVAEGEAICGAHGLASVLRAWIMRARCGWRFQISRDLQGRIDSVNWSPKGPTSFRWVELSPLGELHTG